MSDACYMRDIKYFWGSVMDRLRPMDEAPRDGKHILALAKWVCDEFDEDEEITRKNVIRHDWVVIYNFLGMFTTFPYTGSFPKNVEYLGWMPLPAIGDAVKQAQA